MNAATRKSWNRKLLVQFAIGAVMGGVGVALLDRFGLEPREGVTGSHVVAGAIGLVYLLVGLFVGAGTIVPKIGARLLAVEDADELREQKLLLIAGSIAIAGIGLALLALVLSGPDGWIDARTGALVAIGLLAVVFVVGFASRNSGDELNKAVGRDAIYTAWNLLFVVGGGWAILSYGDIVPAPGALDWLSMLAGFGLVGILWQVERRGLGAARHSD